MKILGIVGSLRRNSNTGILVQEAMNGAKEAGAAVEVLSLTGKNIAPCNGCDFCVDAGECSINDDMQSIYGKLVEADGIFIGTPVYFWSVSGQVKVFIDRTYALMQKREMRGKIGGIAVVARRAGCANAYSLLTTFFVQHRMSLAGGIIGYADKERDINHDKEAMTESRLVGKAMVRAIQRANPSAK
ncbi:MAG: flavodoxin family protein [Chloroflexota bacterium]|nr:flavodoxin family protein [Chloroflexota bacterium]